MSKLANVEYTPAEEYKAMNDQASTAGDLLNKIGAIRVTHLTQKAMKARGMFEEWGYLEDAFDMAKTVGTGVTELAEDETGTYWSNGQQTRKPDLNTALWVLQYLQDDNLITSEQIDIFMNDLKEEV
ncbi:hypothetical protein N6G95_09490 [Pediococcus inopinatus]|uniref:hypothetical protein n=1 Tax=Pediococcus inopinatus TaxID=114090 RepID=UPI002B25CB95|nr:hypothetical protein [Pediococcus inopinatus]WPC19436.1 hypothetical protein N6G95_09490 [Pediococcus inopinatus]